MARAKRDVVLLELVGMSEMNGASNGYGFTYDIPLGLKHQGGKPSVHLLE
jgi:hypothetical protein